MPHMGNPQKAADAVIRKAFELGSEDNLTVVIIMFDWQLERMDELLEKWEGTPRGFVHDRYMHMLAI
jgi:serine/threonine protein phosphatase PrpC